MKKQNLKQESVYLFSDITKLSEVDEDGYTSIPIFREGQFEHPWYGTLDFNKEYLNTIVKNFRKNIVPRAISFDQDHEPGQGALAWVKEATDGVFLKEVIFDSEVGQKVKTFLFAKIKYTSKGKELIDGGVFRYFSSEIHPEFTTHEMHQLGEDEDETAVVKHGATLIGGGFTNRPFIPNLGGVYSESVPDLDGVNVVMSSDFKDSGSFLGYVFTDEAPVQKLTVPDEGTTNEPDAAAESTNEEPVELATQGDGMKFSEVIAHYSELEGSAKVEYLRDAASKMESDAEKASLEALAQAEQSAIEFSAKLADEKHKLSAVEKRNTELSNKMTNLTSKLVDVKADAYESKVKAFASKLVEDKQHLSAVKVAKEFLLSVKPSSRELKFSTLAEEGDADVDLFEVIENIFNALPEAARFSDVAAIETVETKPDQEPLETPEAPKDAPVEDPRIALFTQKYSQAPSASVVPFIMEDGELDLDAMEQASAKSEDAGE